MLLILGQVLSELLVLDHLVSVDGDPVLNRIDIDSLLVIVARLLLHAAFFLLASFALESSELGDFGLGLLICLFQVGLQFRNFLLTILHYLRFDFYVFLGGNLELTEALFSVFFLDHYLLLLLLRFLYFELELLDCYVDLVFLLFDLHFDLFLVRVGLTQLFIQIINHLLELLIVFLALFLIELHVTRILVTLLFGLLFLFLQV